MTSFTTATYPKFIAVTTHHHLPTLSHNSQFIDPSPPQLIPNLLLSPHFRLFLTILNYSKFTNTTPGVSMIQLRRRGSISSTRRSVNAEIHGASWFKHGTLVTHDVTGNRTYSTVSYRHSSLVLYLYGRLHGRRSQHFYYFVPPGADMKQQ